MTSSNRREREIARAKFERQQARRAEREAKAKSRQRATAIVVIAALVVAGVGWAIFSLTGGGESPATSVSEETIDPVIDETTEVDAPSEVDAPAEADDSPPAATVADLCVDPVPVRADDLSFDAPPAPGTATGGTLTLVTNCGDIAIDLLPDAAPATVASIEFLTQNGFYDATACHRLTTAGLFVLQCGDPAGNGTGGPGYQLPDENLPTEGEANYPAGTVAMANAGPGTSGSQFFLVYEDTTLPAGYTIWGQISQGLDIVRAIADAGTADDGGDGPPAQPLVIESATVGGTG